MFLVLAATEFELNPFLEYRDWGSDECMALCAGVGPVETAVRVTKYLAHHVGKIEAVVNFGIGGAYMHEDLQDTPALLDICVAKNEILGDFGICYPEHIDTLPTELTGTVSQPLDDDLRERAERILEQRGFSFVHGNFVTVNGVSGTRLRGDMLRKKHTGICENMEGAAVARVCAEYSLPLLELRVVSNFVEDRDVSRWKLEEACQKSAMVTSILIKEMMENR